MKSYKYIQISYHLVIYPFRLQAAWLPFLLLSLSTPAQKFKCLGLLMKNDESVNPMETILKTHGDPMEKWTIQSYIKLLTQLREGTGCC